MSPSHAGLPRAGNSIRGIQVEVGGRAVHYLTAGAGPRVVLLHGGASDSWDWAGAMAALAHSYALYAPDLVGFGLSRRNGVGYYLSDFVQFALDFMASLGSGPKVLVGHSLGGRICLEIALEHPELVNRLVLVNSVGFGKLSQWGMLLGTLAWMGRRLLRRPQPYPRFLREHRDAPDWMCLDRLPALRVPTLIVWSRHDPYCPVAGALKARDLIPGARLALFPGYSHAPHVRHVAAFNNVLQRFLDS